MTNLKINIRFLMMTLWHKIVKIDKKIDTKISPASFQSLFVYQNLYYNLSILLIFRKLDISTIFVESFIWNI